MTHEVRHPMHPGFGGERYAALHRRGEALGTSSVNPFVMAVTGEWLSGHGRPHMYFTHPPVEDKEAYLSSIAVDIAEGMGTEVPARMLKTVTLKFQAGETPQRVLVGTVGRPIDTPVKRKIATDFGLSRNVAKGASINPHDGWDPSEELKLDPGVVGPLLGFAAGEAVSAYYFLEEYSHPDEPAVPVELALSPEDSLVVRYQDLEEMLPLAQAAFINPDFFRVLPVPETDPAAGGELSMMARMVASLQI